MQTEVLSQKDRKNLVPLAIEILTQTSMRTVQITRGFERRLLILHTLKPIKLLAMYLL